SCTEDCCPCEFQPPQFSRAAQVGTDYRHAICRRNEPSEPAASWIAFLGCSFATDPAHPRWFRLPTRKGRVLDEQSESESGSAEPEPGSEARSAEPGTETGPAAGRRAAEARPAATASWPRGPLVASRPNS